MNALRKAWDSLPDKDKRPAVQAMRDFTAILIRLARKIERISTKPKP